MDIMTYDEFVSICDSGCCDNSKINMLVIWALTEYDMYLKFSIKNNRCVSEVLAENNTKKEISDLYWALSHSTEITKDIMEQILIAYYC